MLLYRQRLSSVATSHGESVARPNEQHYDIWGSKHREISLPASSCQPPRRIFTPNKRKPFPVGRPFLAPQQSPRFHLRMAYIVHRFLAAILPGNLGSKAFRSLSPKSQSLIPMVLEISEAFTVRKSARPPAHPKELPLI